MTPRTVSILGSTGSIGTQTLQVLHSLGSQYQLRWITCNTKAEELAHQVAQYQPYGVALRDEEAFTRFKELLPSFTGPILCGEDGLCEAAADAENDIVMSAMVGFSGVVPTLAAIRAGHIIALANKESLVSAGSIIMAEARTSGATILAVDSEHSAVLQCLVGEAPHSIQRIILTASGGPFRTFTDNQMDTITVEQALRHPNWNMGNKITIDSATLMNKGFEVIEAYWLFHLNPHQIQVVVHPQSIIHSLVEFVDGSVKAQLGHPSMLVPIQYALTFPDRRSLNVQPFNLAEIGTLTFEEPDTKRFPCLDLAYHCLEQGGTAGCILNAANEVAVHAFLSNKITFRSIAQVIGKTVEGMKFHTQPSLATILEADAEARVVTRDFIRRVGMQ